MALKDKTTFIAGIQAFCDAMNLAWANDGGAGVAPELFNPMHPLRRVEKLFKMNDDGVVTEDLDYIDESYAGNYPSKGNELDKTANKIPITT